jgi:hypothetical protein
MIFHYDDIEIITIHLRQNKINLRNKKKRSKLSVGKLTICLIIIKIINRHNILRSIMGKTKRKYVLSYDEIL